MHKLQTIIRIHAKLAKGNFLQQLHNYIRLFWATWSLLSQLEWSGKNLSGASPTRGNMELDDNWRPVLITGSPYPKFGKSPYPKFGKVLGKSKVIGLLNPWVAV